MSNFFALNNLKVLKSVPELSDRQLSGLIANSKSNLVKSIAELVWNIAHGVCKISKEQTGKLLQHKKQLKILKRKRLAVRIKRSLLSEKPKLARLIVESALPYLKQLRKSEKLNLITKKSKLNQTEDPTDYFFESNVDELHTPDLLEKLWKSIDTGVDFSNFKSETDYPNLVDIDSDTPDLVKIE